MPEYEKRRPSQLDRRPQDLIATKSLDLSSGRIRLHSDPHIGHGRSPAGRADVDAGEVSHQRHDK